MAPDARTDELDTLVRAIWGPRPPERPDDPELRALQNQALALAIRAYLQSYLDDASFAGMG